MLENFIKIPGKQIMMGIKICFAIALGFLLNSQMVFAQEKEFSDANSFYEQYGSGTMIFSDGAFYYASKGKAGTGNGVRYGVAGQKFTIKLNNGKSFFLEIALNDGSNDGSCKRISYQKKEGYYYSLYEVAYEQIFERIQKKYPDWDPENFMYNQQVHFQIDFILCLTKNEKDLGRIVEKENGQIEKIGMLYNTWEAISDVSNWSKETKEALKGYFGIRKTIYQPSSWYIIYHKADSLATGIMNQQQFFYGKAKKLQPCSYKKVITVTLNPGTGTSQGKSLNPQCYLLKSEFQGWSLTEGGEICYQDQQSVRNLSSRHNDVIALYANWSEGTLILPSANKDNYQFMGWSREKYEVLSDNSNEAEMKKLDLMQPGEEVSFTEDTTLYAVWKQIQYKVKFLKPEKDKNSIFEKYYTREAVLKIRKLIQQSGFAGESLNLKLIQEKFV